MSLEAALAYVLKEVKGAAIRPLSKFPDIRVLPIDSQSLILNRVLGRGGWPRGHIVEIFGNENTGKTTLLYHAIAQAQADGLTTALVDAEHRTDPDYARKLGVNPDKLIFLQPSSGEEAMEVIKSMAKSGEVDLIGVDSVDAIRPAAEDDGAMGDALVGKHAKLINQGIRQLSQNRGKCCTIFTNQIRMNPGQKFGNPEYQPGGGALKFYASIRMELRRGDFQENAAEERTGNVVRIKAVKNSVAPPFRHGEFRIIYGQGIDKIYDVFEAAKESGILTKRGSWYYLLHDGKETSIGQGETLVIRWLKENGRAEKLRSFVKKSAFYLGEIGVTKDYQPTKPAENEEVFPDGEGDEDAGDSEDSESAGDGMSGL